MLLQSNMVSPFTVHQQQVTMLAQQQSLLMAAAAKSTGMHQKFILLNQARTAGPANPTGTSGPYSTSSYCHTKGLAEIDEWIALLHFDQTNFALFSPPDFYTKTAGVDPI